jgi:hypothetical protein
VLCIIPNTTGGLNVPNFDWQSMALKVNWVKTFLFFVDDELRFATAPKWVHLSNYALRHVGGKIVFYGNLNCEDFKHIPVHYEFWLDVIQSWYRVNPAEESNKESKLLWHNSYIKVAKKTIFSRKLVEAGLLFVHQLFHRGRFCTYEEFRHQFDIQVPLMEYLSITHAVPLHWAEEIKMLNTENLSNSLEGKNILTTRQTYSQLVKQNSKYPDGIVAKWADYFHLDDSVNWDKIFLSPYKCTVYCKLREFQFKFIHNLICLNDRLCKWGKVESSLCDFCNSVPDCLLHRFWLCPAVNNVWAKATQVLETLGCTEPLSVRSMFLLMVEEESIIAQYVILYTKFYLFRCFIQKNTPTDHGLVSLLEQSELVERHIALKNNKIETHNNKWKVFQTTLQNATT